MCIRDRHIDIIHGHGYTFQDDVTTVHFLRKAFIQQLKKFRDITYFRNKLPRIETWLERKLLNSSKHLIAVSSMIKRDLMKSYGINSEKISIVHNGVNIREFSPSNKRERKYIRLEYGFEEEAICILFVGGKSYERKGLQFILRAMQFIPKDIYLFVIGGGYEKYKRLIEKLGIVDRVVFIPYINDIRQAYAITDIFILPTIYDPFPLAALEAMASGLPIIISSLAGTIDILRDGINGIILEDPSDIKHLAELITVLVDDHKLREKIGTNARLTAEKLSWENVAREVVKVYEEVA